MNNFMIPMTFEAITSFSMVDSTSEGWVVNKSIPHSFNYIHSTSKNTCRVTHILKKYLDTFNTNIVFYSTGEVGRSGMGIINAVMKTFLECLGVRCEYCGLTINYSPQYSNPNARPT